MTIRSAVLLNLAFGVMVTNCLAACSTPSESESISSALGIAIDNTCWLGKGADAAGSIMYSDNCQFDRQLRKSLSSSVSAVTVTTAGAFKQDAVPNRLGNWLERIRESKGSITTCSEDVDGSMGVIAILPLVWQALGIVKTYALYDPAKNYDAVLVSEKDGPLVKVMFAKRGAAPSCPAGTTKTTAVA